MELRERLADYLSQQQFRVTPDSTVLLDDRAASQKALAEAACAVHFLGDASDAPLQAVEAPSNPVLVLLLPSSDSAQH